MSAQVDRLTEGDRHRMEVAEAPVLRALDRAADDWHSLLHSDHRRTGKHLAGLTLLPRPLREHAQRIAAPDDVAHDADRLAIGLATTHGRRPEEPDERADDRVVVRLLLRDVVERSRHYGTERPRIEPGEVVEAEDERTIGRNAFAAVHAQRRTRADRRIEERPTKELSDLGAVHGREAASRCSTSSAMRLTTSSTSRSVVSICSASCAGRIRAASLWAGVRRSVASAPPPMSGGPAWRRSARVPASALRSALISAFGATTVPMSRPSITTSPCSPSSRWRSRITSRTSGCRATTGTLRSICDRRIEAVTSVPAIRTRPASSNVTGFAEASSPSGAPSPSGRPFCIASHVTARYIAPVSR